MANQGLQICPHTCGCDISDNAVAIMSRRPKWLGRCPIYESTGTGMKYHLVRDMHRRCKATCPAYTSTNQGRDLTPQEFEAWVPYIGHLPEFRPHIPTQHQHLIVTAGRDPSSLPTHPLIAPEDPPPPIPARYDEFFASLSSKPSPAPKRGGTRITLGSLPQPGDVSGRTYDDFFSSYLGLRATTADQTSALRILPSSSSAESMAKEKRLLDALNSGSTSSHPSAKSTPPEAPSNSRVSHVTKLIPESYDDFFAPPNPPGPPGYFSSFRVAPANQSATSPQPNSLEGASNASTSHATNSILHSKGAPRNPPGPHAYFSSFRVEPPTQSAPPPPRAPTPPPPPPPPTRDLAAFQRILAATSPQAMAAAMLAAYTALPAAQPLLWDHLSNTATAPNGSLHLVPRHQVCRHCAEDFDTTDPSEHCTWHYGGAVLDPAAWAASAAQPPHADPQKFYYWDCCGARLSARAPGCIVTAHAPLLPPNDTPMRLAAGPEPPKGKRKRARGPTVRCGHCAAAYRENDGGRCRWHDSGRVVNAHGGQGQGGRWSCCGQEGDAAGCVVSNHVPPRTTKPK